MHGSTAAENAIKVMKDKGIDISNHQSKTVNEKLIEESHLVLTMSIGHKNALILQYPQHKEKILMLNEYAFGRNKDIEDPFGGSKRDYERARDEIIVAIEKIIERGWAKGGATAKI